ncbi:DUF1643 domain-containing protein [Noviherbaspirillum pedocola]|uniref:DUF1643 domain-containing protein n=1 Tax=Noviherbaspirillum pedocola TaxID=2801341 RepID=A0A934W2C8_9BURK|nr:DUF1643 domain-containing protein [Noviherbaspirillum pedocola]MBK4736181.1 DUF1643 domain-containing protein [Noviherbaspirillum pedocola]
MPQFFFDTRTLPLLPDTVGVRVSDCGRYRYLLWRIWDAQRPKVTFIALAPEGADDTRDDASVRKFQQLAQQAGYGGFYVVCLFACRAAARTGDERSSTDNDVAILAAARSAAVVVRSWGEEAVEGGRDAAVLALLREAGIISHALDHDSRRKPVAMPHAGAYADASAPI